MMKKILFLILILSIPWQLSAISNLKINGESTYLVTSLPVQLEMTCDLAQTGNQVEFQVFFDVNNSGTVETDDFMLDFYIITDGINWIRDPNNPDEDIPGDETGIDSKLKSTFPFEQDERLFQTGQFLLLAKDEDNSTASATIQFNIQPTPPYITGKVTDKSNGQSLPGIIITADSESEDAPDAGIGISDENGDYLLSVDAGDWKIVAFDFLQNQYQPSDSLPMTIATSETKSLNIQMEPYTTFISGSINKEDGTPISGIQILAGSIEAYDFSYAFSDAQGEYQVGVNPGTVVVSAPMFMNIGLPQSNWPENHYLDPQRDTLSVAEGQTVTRNFTFRPYTSFIEGDCKVGVRGLAGVEITAMVTDIQSGTLNIATGISDLRGHYKMGVLPGRVVMLTASKDGYDMTSPLLGYSNFMVNANETVSGKDFQFIENTEGMSIAGQVTYEGGAAAANVYVVAIEDFETSAEAYLISSTDANGNYEFPGLFTGVWKVGVYQEGYVSEPPIYYTELYYGVQVTDANFVLTTGSAVEQSNRRSLPQKFYLAQNYPNPFKPGAGTAKTKIKFYIEKNQFVNIRLYNIRGQLVNVLQSGMLNKGHHQVNWDGRNLAGDIVPSGVYFYKINTGTKIETRRLLIVR
jgi:hypothetical protein